MGAKDGKTEKPTPKKIRDARKEGQFPRTPDAATWLGIAAGVSALPLTARLALQAFRERLALLPDVVNDPQPARALASLAELPPQVLLAVAPMSLAALAGAVFGAAIQGVHPTTKTLKFKGNRLSPKEGLKRMFGPKSLWEALKSLLKVTTIAAVVVVLAHSLLPELLANILPLSVVADRARNGLETLVWAGAVVGLLLAGADWAVQRHQVMKQLMMSPREVRDEYKQTEGDPMVKSAIRSKQMAMSRNRMLSAVTESDVVLVNPTHFAVALKYEARRGAPRVVAKGAGSLALKIRQKAHEARVPVVEDKPLARTLYRICDLDDEIPAELYLAVARILAFVMAAGRPGAPPRPGPTTDLPDLPTKTELRARKAKQQREARARKR